MRGVQCGLYHLFFIFFFLTIGGKAVNAQDVEIVLPRSATLVERNAASQLASHLSQSYSNSFQIKQENEIYGSSPKIFVGNTTYLKTRYGNYDSVIGVDGIFLKSVGNNLILTGNGERGILYSIYEFLERYVGVKFWSTKDTEYPKKRSYKIINIDYQYTPFFKYRAYYNYEANSDPEFSTKLRFNGHFQPISGKWGNSIKILGWTHTFDQIIPVKKYFKTNPEWFSDPHNKNLPCSRASVQPKGQETQLCLTNLEMKKEFLKNLLAWIAKNKSVGIISVSQNDRGEFCDCDNCKQVIQSEGTVSGLLIHFVNDVAAEVSRIYPNKKIITLAYNETESIPRIVKPSKNVIIQFAPISSNMFYPLNSFQNRDIGQKISEWAKISNSMFYWGYNNNFSHDLLPYPSLGRLSKDLTFLKSSHIDRVFLQGGVVPDNYGYFNKMQTWVVSKLLWDPTLDEDKLIEEFFNSYYGVSGKSLYNYYRYIEEAFARSDQRLKAYHSDYSFINQQDLKVLESHFDIAIQNATKKVYQERVLEEKKSFDYLRIYLNKATKNIRDSFIEQISSYKNGENQVSKTMITYSSKLELMMESRSIANINWDKENSVTVEDSYFVLANKGVVTDKVVDESAGDKSSVFMKASSKAWSIQFPFKNRIIDPDLTYEIVPSIKVQSSNIKLTNQYAIFGVYNVKTKSNITIKKVKLSDYSTNDYHSFNLGPVKLDEGCSLFVSFPTVYSDQIYIYIDKLVIKKIIH